MDKRQVKRISRELTGDERERLARHRQQIADELPDLEAHDQMRKDAREESTLSGDFAAPSMGATFRWPRSPPRRMCPRSCWMTF